MRTVSNDDNLVILVLERDEKSDIYMMNYVRFHLSAMNEFYLPSVRGGFMNVKYNATSFEI